MSSATAAAAAAAEDKKKLTVFRSDRHEDVAACIFAAVVVIGIMLYMAFLVGEVKIGATAEGKILELKVAEGQTIKKDDALYKIEAVEKKMVKGQMEEKVVQKDVKSTVAGKVLKVEKKVGDAVKKGAPVLVVAPDKGTLP